MSPCATRVGKPVEGPARWMFTNTQGVSNITPNPMFSITEDRVGLHYSGGGFCTDEINYIRFKERNTRNCGDNLKMAYEPHGISRDDFDFDCCFNVFMNLTFQTGGAMKLKEPHSKPGDYIDLKAEMDSIVAISNCPQDRNPCNAFKPTPLKIQVFPCESKT